ncbi:hypothetical protein [Streptomyces albofaciens]|uniref:hypothetical protein n=1 Tax=Streptomyces albofaciens TaxID=66866 RepID=UPI000AE384A0|nr:hypothetical protein [Streptomyces albofaciens]
MTFNGFASDFVYRSIPVPNLTIEQVVRIGVTYARRSLTWHADAWGKGYGCS